MGTAVGGFTNNFFRWLHDEGACSDRVAAWDWRTLPALVKAGEFTEDDMTEVRTAAADFLAPRTKAEILDAAIRYRLLCIGISDTADLAASAQLAARGYYATVGAGRAAAHHARALGQRVDTADRPAAARAAGRRAHRRGAGRLAGRRASAAGGGYRGTVGGGSRGAAGDSYRADVRGVDRKGRR